MDLLTELKNKMLQPGKLTLITGDFNLCYMTNGNNRMRQGLDNQEFKQLVKEVGISTMHTSEMTPLSGNNQSWKDTALTTATMTASA